MSVQFILRANSLQFAPVAQDAGADVRAIRPGQGAVLYADFPKLCRRLQRSKNAPVQNGFEVKHALPSIPKREPNAGGTDHFALDNFRNWFHINSIMAEVRWAAKAVFGAIDSIGA